MNSSSIPSLDISEYESDPNRFLPKLSIAYREWGFAGITGHNIEHTEIQAALQAAQWFFNQPLDYKQSFKSDNSWARGYVPMGTETAKGANHADLKEFFHLGREVPNRASAMANIWPDDKAFQTAFSTLYQRLDALAQTLLSAIAQILGLSADYFRQSVSEGEALLRILHYPPILNENVPNVRAAAHEDINLITLLVGSEQEGLEVLSRRGDWVPISLIEGTIICNLGDMMQRLTNRRMPSTTHRVVNPKGDKARQSRYSVPFFVHPDPSFSLACLPQCCDAQHPKAFNDIKAGDYHAQRLREIGFGK